MNQKLVEDNMGLVYFIINKYYPTFITDEDITQCGMLGLCKAANTYEADKGVTFASYASKCIINEIKNEFIRRNKHLGVLSLESKCFSDDGNAKTIGDFVVGEEDVDFFDYDKFYSQLSAQDREVVELRKLGLNDVEIAKRLGCSRQNVDKRLRRLRNKWRKLYGN